MPTLKKTALSPIRSTSRRASPTSGMSRATINRSRGATRVNSPPPGNVPALRIEPIGPHKGRRQIAQDRPRANGGIIIGAGFARNRRLKPIGELHEYPGTTHQREGVGDQFRAAMRRLVEQG